MATYSVWQAAAIGGSPLSLKPGTSITVNREADGALVPLKADRLGAGSKSNPFIVGSDGIARFYAAAGRYRITATLSGFDPIEWKDVALGTAAEVDFDDLSGDIIVNGQPTGVRLLFDDATAAADPGTGEWRANHATFASINALYIDNAQQNGDSITTWLDALDDGGTSAHRCVLRYENIDDPQQWAEFNVTGSVTDSTGFRTLTVTPRAQAGWPFTAGDVTAATFDRTGLQGNNGADGTDPGILLTFDADTADSNQGSGKVWLDNATLTSATVLYISKTNRAGSDIAAKLARLDDSTNTGSKAEGVLTRASDGEQLTFAIGTVTDATGYVKIAISGVAGAASFTADDPLSFQAERVGDTGGGLANVVEDTTPQLGGTLDTNAHQIRWSKGADVASGSTLTLGDDGNYFDITGTTTVTAIATKAVGTVVKLHFDAALILTHHATDLILPGGANITTAAGDEAEFIEYASGDWRCTSYSKADGTPLVGGGGGDVTTEQLDALHFDQRVQAMHLAEVMGEPLFLGPDGSALHDGFDVLDYVDVAWASSLDTGDAGELKSTGATGGLISQAMGTAIGDYTTRPTAFHDGNNNQASSASSVDGAAVSGVRRIGKDFGSGNAKVVNGFVIYGANNTGYYNGTTETVTFTLKGSNTDPTTTSWTGTTIGSVSPFTNIASTNSKSSTGNANTTAYRYVWVEINISTTSSRHVAELEFYEPTGSADLEVSSLTISAAAQPDWIRAAVRMLDTEDVVINTDVLVDLSRDDGATWTAAVLVERYVQPDGVRVLDTGKVDVTGQPSGTELKWRIRTDNEVSPVFLSIAIWAGED